MSSLRLLAEVEAILAGIEILPFDVPAEGKYGGICAELEAAGKPIGPNDLPITAHANALGAMLVTAKVDEFRRSCRLQTRKLGLLDRA